MSIKTISDIKAEEYFRKYINRVPDHARFESEIIAALVKFYNKNPDGLPNINLTNIGWFCIVEVV